MPSPAPAFLCAGLFAICALLVLVAAIIGWDGSADNPDLVAALVGVAFSEDLTGNVDFAVSASMTVACTTLTFVPVLAARVGFARWVLGAVGALTTVYYLYAVIWLIANDSARVIAMVAVSLLLWAAATVLVLLPVTARAMRGHRAPPPAPWPR